MSATYAFEIERPNDSHFDFMARVCPVENEPLVRPDVGRLLKEEDMLDGYRGDGTPVRQ